MLWWTVGYMVVFLGYLLWLKRYFVATPIAAPPGPEISPPPAGLDHQSGSY
jgi:hypothetical protein